MPTSLHSTARHYYPSLPPSILALLLPHMLDCTQDLREGRTAGRVLVPARLNERGQHGRGGGREGGTEALSRDGERCLDRCHPSEGLLACQKFPEHDAVGVDVGSGGVRLVANHLTGHVPVGARLTCGGKEEKVYE